MARNNMMNPYLRQQQIFGQFGNIDQNDYGMGSMEPMPTYQTPVGNADPGMNYAPNDIGNLKLGQTMRDLSPAQNVGMGAQSPTMPGPTTPQTPNSGIDPELQATLDAINKVYTPDYTSRDRLNRLLDDTPQRNKPNWARKLVAGGMSLKAEDPIGTAEKVMYAPYLRDQAEWTSKTQPFANAAQLENTANINERTLAGNVVTAQTQANKLAEQARQANLKDEVARRKAENDNIRARAYAAKNNGYTVMKAGDRVIAVHPETKQRVDLGPSGGLDRETELDIMGEWGVMQQEARGTAAVKTAQAGAQATGRGVIQVGDKLYEPDPTNGGYRPVQGVPPGTATRPGTPPRQGDDKTNPLDEARSMNNRYNNIYNLRPDLREFIEKPDQVSGNWNIGPPPKKGWGFESTYLEKLKKYNELRAELDMPPVDGNGMPLQEQPSTAPPQMPPGTDTGLGPRNIPQSRSNPRDPNYGRAGRETVTTGRKLDSVLPPDPRQRQSTNPNTSRARTNKVPEQLDMIMGGASGRSQRPEGVEPGQSLVKDPATGATIKVTGNVDDYLRDHPGYTVVYR